MLNQQNGIQGDAPETDGEAEALGSDTEESQMRRSKSEPKILYMRSPDYKYKEERVQRLVQDVWLKSRGKEGRMPFGSVSPYPRGKKKVITSGVNFVQVRSMDALVQLNENDAAVLVDLAKQKSNHIS